MFFKYTWIQYHVQFYRSNRVPFDISLFLFWSFAFSSSNTSIFSESIVWSPGKYRNCLIVWDRSSSIKSDCFCLSVYGRCFPPCEVCNRDTGIGEATGLWNVESWNLQYVILLEEFEILLKIWISNLNATDNRNPESTAPWNPESKTFLDHLLWGELLLVMFCNLTSIIDVL